MPEIEGDFFVISCWREIGRVQSGYMSAEPLSWTEINSWATATNSRMTKWELETIRKLSCEYVAQLHASKDDKCPPPNMPEVNDEWHLANAKRMRKNMLKNL